MAPAEADLEVTADDSEVTETTLFFEGNVSVKQGYRTVFADSVNIDQENETAIASGNVTLREPGVLMTGSEIVTTACQSRLKSVARNTFFTNGSYRAVLNH